jgi:hypothetical protein
VDNFTAFLSVQAADAAGGTLGNSSGASLAALASGYARLQGSLAAAQGAGDLALAQNLSAVEASIVAANVVLSRVYVRSLATD